MPCAKIRKIVIPEECEVNTHYKTVREKTQSSLNDHFKDILGVCRSERFQPTLCMRGKQRLVMRQNNEQFKPGTSSIVVTIQRGLNSLQTLV